MDVSALLQINTIVHVRVKLKVLLQNSCAGELIGVDESIPIENIAANITSQVKVNLCARQGIPLVVTFEGSVVLAVLLFSSSEDLFGHAWHTRSRVCAVVSSDTPPRRVRVTSDPTGCG
ncbi:hypothetical protein MRX96_020806 [Rhipicephalus microplus]